MKKTLGMLFLVLLTCSGLILYQKQEACAEAINNSQSNIEDVLTGSIMQPMGVYLVDGTSSITKNSTITIGAGGSTTATMRCDVSVLVIVERYNDGGWEHWHSWVVEEENAYSAAASKTLAVARGYSYRVRCTHKAATDTTSSWTGALKM